MKVVKIATVLAALVSINTWACPELTGSFKCQIDGKEKVTTISMQKRGNVTAYQMDDTTVLADNKVYKIPDAPGLKAGTIRSWCQADLLKGLLTGKVYNQSQFVGNLTVNLVARLDQDLNLVQEAKGSIVGGGKTYPIDNTITCTRM